MIFLKIFDELFESYHSFLHKFILNFTQVFSQPFRVFIKEEYYLSKDLIGTNIFLFKILEK
jgi:hypothetical protein